MSPLLLFGFFAGNANAGILASCYVNLPVNGREGYPETIQKLGIDPDEHCLDFEDSAFKFGETIYFIYRDAIAPSAIPIRTRWRGWVCTPQDNKDLKGAQEDCYMTFALKTSNLSRKVDEKIKFNNGKTYTFFAESKKGTWLMKDENGKCVYYKPSPAPKPKAKDCEKKSKTHETAIF